MEVLAEHRDYQAEARALRAKFFPKAAPVVIAKPAPRIVEITRPTYDSVRNVRAIVVPGRVYGPFEISRDFLHIASPSFEATSANLRNRHTARGIIRATAEAHGLSVEIIVGRRRDKLVVAARHDAMARIYVSCPHLSMVQIGQIFERDHTTILNAVRKMGVWTGDAHRQTSARDRS